MSSDHPSSPDPYLTTGEVSVLSAAQVRELLRELQTSRMELAVQNEELRAAQVELGRSRDLYYHLFHEAPLGYLTIDERGLVVQANDTFCRMVGRLAPRITGRPVSNFVAEEDRPVFLARHNAFFKHPDDKSMELRLLRADGSTFHALLEGRWEREPDLRDSPHHPHLLLAVRDVTEARQLEDALAHAHKMEAIGRLAGGIAHDFNNLLTVISGNLEEAMRLTERDPLVTELLGEVRDASDRAAKLTRQLLAFSRKRVVERQRFDVNENLRGMKALLSRIIGDAGQLDLDLDPGPHFVDMNAGQLEQIVTNLVVNARDAMPTGGQCEIRVRTVESSEVTAPLPPHSVIRRYVQIEVKDTGEGMGPELIARIFEPFFTTKAIDRGTGLGLSMVYGIVEQSGGVVDVDSQVGQGSTFRVFLPAAPDDGVEGELARLPGRSPRTGRIRVLVVEDQATLRALVVRMLQGDLLEVIAAGSTEDALGLLASQSVVPDLLLTDVVMPGESGPRLAERLRERWPALPVVFMSGFSSQGIPGAEAGGPPTAFLAKPFSRPELLACIQGVLGQGVLSTNRGPTEG